MDVSIIIINYNTFKLTKDAIRSVYEKTKGLEYEVILVDNGSSECNPDVFRELFPQLILIKSKENLGFSRGNNLGIAEAQGEYILLLNSDTTLLNNAVYLSWQKLGGNNKIGILSSMLVSVDNTLQYPAESFPNLWTEIKELLRLNKGLNAEKKANLYMGAAFDHLSEKSTDWVWGAFFMMRKSLLDKLDGSLSDEIFMYAEDMDWCWQARKLGYDICYYPAAKVRHLGGGSMYETSEEKKHFSVMLPNKFWVLKKHQGRVYALALFIIKAVHYFTLRTQKDFWKANEYLQVVLGNRPFWLNSNV